MNLVLIFNEDIKSFYLNSLWNYVAEKYNVTILNSIKEYLKVNKQLEKCKTDIFFITTCLQNNILPNFTHFKTTNQRLNNQPIYSTCRKLILTTELSNHKEDLTRFNKSIKYIHSHKLFEINSGDLNSIYFILDKRILNNFIDKIKQNAIKKLKNLNIHLSHDDLIIDQTFVNRRRNNFDVIELPLDFKPVFDLSGELDKNELDLLGKGLNYGIKNRDFNKFEILCRFEELAQKLQGEQLTSESINDKYSVNPLDTFFGNLQFLSEEL